MYALVAALGEPLGMGRWRRETLAGATGRLVLLGAGPGFDLRHLPGGVLEAIAVEPDPAMLRLLRRRAAEAADAGVPVAVVRGVGERLPLNDNSIDAVLCAFVLCSVTDVPVTLAEVRRVLRPGGTLHLVEHVRADEGSRLASLQDALDRPWAPLTGGCHPNRRTRSALDAAGFDVAGLRDVRLRLDIPLLAPKLRGTTRAVRRP